MIFVIKIKPIMKTMKLLSGSNKRYILLIAGTILSILSTAQTKLCFGNIIDKKSSELLHQLNTKHFSNKKQ